METVEVATKELKVETRLRNIENQWGEEQLGFTRHRDTEVKPRKMHRIKDQSFFILRCSNIQRTRYHIWTGGCLVNVPRLSIR